MEIKDDCLEITETAVSEEVRVSDVLNPWRLESFFPRNRPKRVRFFDAVFYY